MTMPHLDVRSAGWATRGLSAESAVLEGPNAVWEERRDEDTTGRVDKIACS